MRILRYTMILGLLAFGTVCRAQQTQVLSKLTGIEADSMTITLINSSFDKEELLTKIAVNKADGTFEYKLDIKEARQLIIYPSQKNGQKFKGYIDLFILPGTKLVLTGTLDDYRMEGAPFYTDCNALLDAKRSYKERMAALNTEFKQGQAKGLSKDSLRQAIMPRYEALRSEQALLALDYIKAHPTQDAAATLLEETSNTAEAYEALADNVKQGALSAYIAKVKRRLDNEARRKEATLLTAEGKPAPDFALTDIYGKPLSLASLRGKYVVLDFWGSWCIWCLRGMPKMKEYYAKYSDKLEILGIDCNDTETKWKAAVEKHALPWLHVFNPRTSNIIADYAIVGFPTKIILDPQGNIVKRVVGEDDSFYEFLDELFK